MPTGGSRAAVEPLGVPAIYATGNHDVRAEFHRSLLGSVVQVIQDADDGPVLQVHRVGGLRIIVLDSTIPGAGQGRLTGEHLAELTVELAEPAADGTIVVLHHAPMPPPSPLLSYFALETASRHALARAVAGTDVRLILAGHHHLAQSGMLGAVPVAVAGSTAIRTDPLGPDGHERTWASGTFNLVQVHPDTIVVSVIPVDGAAGRVRPRPRRLPGGDRRPPGSVTGRTGRAAVTGPGAPSAGRSPNGR